MAREVGVSTLIRRALDKAVVSCYRIFETLGYHVTPANYWYPIPSSDTLTDTLFETISECAGLDWNLPKQEYYLTDVFPKYATEVEFAQNPGISLVDAAILHAMIRHHSPRKLLKSAADSRLVSLLVPAS